jgi:hypothetical protein
MTLVNQVLDALFPPKLTAFFQGRKSVNTLTLLLCGAVLTVEKSFADLKTFADRCEHDLCGIA